MELTGTDISPMTDDRWRDSFVANPLFPIPQKQKIASKIAANIGGANWLKKFNYTTLTDLNVGFPLKNAVFSRFFPTSNYKQMK